MQQDRKGRYLFSAFPGGRPVQAVGLQCAVVGCGGVIVALFGRNALRQVESE